MFVEEVGSSTKIIEERREGVGGIVWKMTNFDVGQLNFNFVY